jgi:hypothetical protein
MSDLEDTMRIRRRTQPTPLRDLPTATGNFRLIGYHLKMAVPSRPRKHPRLLEAQARAARLWRRRRPHLERGALHRHEHRPLSDALIVDLTDKYVAGDASLIVELLEATPWQRQVVTAQLAIIDAQTPTHKMGHRARIEDIRFQLETTDR